ncbi:MAG: hypothetical protein AAGI66_04770, partial [Cyanobacteria bacterium P01_H01_bin.74]
MKINPENTGLRIGSSAKQFYSLQKRNSSAENRPNSSVLNSSYASFSIEVSELLPEPNTRLGVGNFPEDDTSPGVGGSPEGNTSPGVGGSPEGNTSPGVGGSPEDDTSPGVGGSPEDDTSPGVG